MLKRNSYVIFFTFVFGLWAGVVGKPIWKQIVMIANQEQFSKLVYKCDSAMKNHLLAKHRVLVYPSENNVSKLVNTEVGLLDCQEYDLKQKSLIQWGLSNNELSKMVLVASENNGTQLRDIVQLHEFRY